MIFLPLVHLKSEMILVGIDTFKEEACMKMCDLSQTKLDKMCEECIQKKMLAFV